MILITGGAGFIGSNIAAALDRAGREIAICDRLGAGDKWRNIAKRDLAAVVAPEGLDDFLATPPGDVAAVVHMGAISATTETDADLIVATNLTLSQRLWGWCAAHRVPLIYASSAATYGDGGDGAAGFDDDPPRLSKLRPLNPYGWSKLAFDRFALRQVREGRPSPPQWAGLKFFNVYGPNEYHKGGMRSVVHQVHGQVRDGGPARLFRSHRPDYPDGGQMRDFVHVDDCVAVVTWLLATPAVSGLFNLGSGTARSFADLARAVFSALDRPAEIEFVDTPLEIRDRYQYFTEAPLGRLRAAGYAAPMTTLEDGVARYVRDHLEADDPYV